MNNKEKPDTTELKGSGSRIIVEIIEYVSNSIRITLAGMHRLLMSDYRIKPSGYLSGTLETGNKLTIDFTLIVYRFLYTSFF